MKKMNASELRAYEIGVKEANKSRCIVPACKSKEMKDFMNEVKNGLLPLIKAYNAGVACEIGRQAMLEM